MAEATRPRQLIVLCDGTNNNLTGGQKDTHVVRLAELLTLCPDDQRLVFYDPGVGNAGELPGATLWDTARRWGQRMAGLAFGRGAYENMAECYQFLMQHHRPGDQIHIFGFSRGAFTARSVAGLVNQFGLLAPHMVSMLPTLLHVYFSDRGKMGTRWQDIAAQSARLFASGPERQVEVHFVGVWDTVATVGMWPFNAKFTTAPQLTGKRFVHVRHALALDEHRAQFKPRPYAEANGPIITQSGRIGSLKQLWFSGAHCDVGGSYTPEQSALARQTLCWLVSEAVQCGLRLQHGGQALDNETRVSQALAKLPHDTPPSAPRRAHCQLHQQPLWALTGMTVREPSRISLDDQDDLIVPAHAHASAEPQQLRFPADSAWSQPRPRRVAWATLACLLSLPLWLLALGQLLAGMPLSRIARADLLWTPGPVWDGILATGRLLAWQLQGPWGGAYPGRCTGSAGWALVWELGFIACYAQVLAWCCTQAFARMAGLRAVDAPAPTGLNLLGWMLPVLVVADVGESLFTGLAWGLSNVQVPGLECVVRVFMMICAVVKFASLLGCFALVGGGLRARLTAARQA